jgi:pyruvate ferredoxin oxidoreductase alpha subunit
MVRMFLEGSGAAAHAVKLCKPGVLAMYPITPSTHIPEGIAQMVADGELDAELIRVESEFSAISACAGASATGVRTFTATSSQGLALMHEVIFAVAGMRLPVVVVVANRALSAPINIWNDHQDSISERDSGWIQFHAETAQEVGDTTIQAFKIAEDSEVLLPVMVNFDGFILTHTYEPVDLPSHEEVDAFLPPYTPKHSFLDPEKPMTQGPFAYPRPYNQLKIDLNEAVENSRKTIKGVHDEFAKKFGRAYGNGFIEEYRNDRDVAIVAMGSVCGTIKEAVDKREDAGLVRVRCYRPLPEEDLKKALKSKKTVIVADKNVALGLNSGVLFSELRDIMYSENERPGAINGVICGVGGVDVTEKNVHNFINRLKDAPDGTVEWLRGYPDE